MNAVNIKGISKVYLINNFPQYKIYTVGDKFSYLREKYLRTNFKSRNNEEDFWALKNITFSVEPGEVMGIIGRNGAGKSTLLKILSKVTYPSQGIITIKGKVGSLLEVGTGIHKELSGRENIFLNGAILGMNKAEIKKKFEDIIYFAGISKFLDVPVKRYSSGMQVRLAFAVAAHLSADILLIDEVLAVGDLEFQKKCLEKMNQITRREGRTILFVSHDMGAIYNLCDRCAYLREGEIRQIGKPAEMINAYMRDNSVSEIQDLGARKDRTGNNKIRLTKIMGKGKDQENTMSFLSGHQLFLRFYYESDDMSENDIVHFYMGVNSAIGFRVFTLSNEYSGEKLGNRNRKGCINLFIPRLPLAKGEYVIDVTIKKNHETVDNIANAAKISVESGGFYRHEVPDVAKLDRGSVLVDHKWTQD